MRRTAFVTLAVASGLLSLAGCGGGKGTPPAPVLDVSGTWSGPVASAAAGPTGLSVALLQNGSALTGTYATSGQTAGTVAGQVNGNTVTLQLTSTTPACAGTLSGTATYSAQGVEQLVFSYGGSTACGGPDSGTGTLTRGPCTSPSLLAYWTPSTGSPQGGFQVPGLVAGGLPAQLGCAEAGVASIQVRVGGVVVPCSGAGSCVDAQTWLCTVEGIAVPLPLPGTYDVRVDAFDAGGVQRYALLDAVDVFGCRDTAAGLFPRGLAGVLRLDYAFPDTAFCAAGSNIEWTLHGGDSLATLADQRSIACGNASGQNPFAVNGGAALAAGVYRLTRIAEVVPGAPARTVHSLCTYPLIVHAGNETVGGVAPLLDLQPYPTGSSCP